MKWLILLLDLLTTGADFTKMCLRPGSDEKPLETTAALTLARTYHEMGGALCSRAMSPAPQPAGNGVKFMILMEGGRVGSTWLVSLLNNHSKVPICHSEALADHLDVNHAWDNLRTFYGQAVKPGTAVGAKQKQGNLLRDQGDGASLVDHLVDDFGVRLVCLSRSNPVEAFLAEVNGDAHQAACSRHEHHEEKDAECYPESAARAVLGTTIWVNESTHVRLNPRMICGTHKFTARTVRFYDYCKDQSERRGAQVFWLEYSDLMCRFDEAMRRLHAFLNIPYEDLQSNQNKLTKEPSSLVPRFDELVQQLRYDTYIKRGALSAGLRMADNCEFLHAHQHNPAFCPM